MWEKLGSLDSKNSEETVHERAVEDLLAAEDVMFSVVSPRQFDGAYRNGFEYKYVCAPRGSGICDLGE